LTFTNYPTSPDITLGYNEVNRLSTLSQPGLGTITFSYTDAELLASDGGHWPTDTVSYGYHPSAPRLRTALTVQQPSGSWSQSYGYDAAHRLQTVTSSAGGFTYNYSGAGARIGSVTLPGALSIVNGYDGSSRLTSTELRNGANVLNAHGYNNLTQVLGSTLLFDDIGRSRGYDLKDLPLVGRFGLGLGSIKALA